MAPFEDTLRQALHDAAGAVTPADDFAAAVARRVRARQRRPLLMSGGALAALALVVAIAVPRLSEPDHPVVVTGPDPDPGATVLTTVPAPPPGETPAPEACANRPASTSSVERGRLPRAVAGAATFWDGRYGYVAGGLVVDGAEARPVFDIVRFDPASGTTSVLPTSLSVAVSNAATVWDGTAAYLFGGSDGDRGGPTDRIVRVNPSAGRSEVLPVVLPVTLTHAHAVWEGRHAYVVGGYRWDSPSGPPVPNDRIIRFTPATGEIRTMATRQPVVPREVRGAVWDGRRILIVVDPSVAVTRPGELAAATVVAYDPAADNATTLPGTFPHLGGAQVAFVCGQLLAFGVDTRPGPFSPGGAPDPASGAVLRLDPSGGPATTIGTLPPYRTGPMISDGVTAWMLGGVGERASVETAEILRFGPPRP
jgi:hypothetical protein